jgi:L-amino acid N-acyltransferase YncA
MPNTVTDRFPRTRALSGRDIVFRPLERADQPALLEFFKRLPVDERRMLKDDVTNPLVISAWCTSIDYDRVLPLLAMDGPRIVGDATLHRSVAGWSQHVAKIRVSIDTDWRRRGLGRALVSELVDAAHELKVSMLDAEIMSEQKGALKLFDQLGFVSVATLPQHVLDLNHRAHDLVVLSRTLIPPEQLSPDAFHDDHIDVGGGG